MNQRLPLRLFFAFLLTTVCHGAWSQGASSVYSRVNRSVGIVIVSTFEGQLVASGSAVTVASQTMVTNRHVLIPGHRYQVYVNGGIYEAYMTSCDSTQDLCLLDVKNLDAKPVEFADLGKLSVGDPVYAVGAPNEIGNIVGVSAVTKQRSYTPPQLTLSNGLVTALRPLEDGTIIQTNAAISPGSSGGGLFDAQGRLVGITSFMMRSGQGLNMALPVTWVARLGVTGAPHALETAAPVIAAPTYTPAPQIAAAPEPAIQLPRQQDIATPAQTPPPHPASHAGSASDSLVRYWWVGLIVLLLLFYFMRRRGSSAEVAYEISAPPPPADPLLQRFMAQAQEELDQERTDLALWNRVIADSKGNMNAARQSYVERRAARLLSAEKDRQWAEAARQNQPH